ncbi:5'-amp-activated protein kinase beta subunit [Anaeramoeba ignava]|uniref:5'-amp-activated protein kinase beta subunit n=1 Tax=Anaeramoeba ignava TaxID=1746090 RepID=A0A9Q0LVW0_ANAIG|nr:5'-amp-activated protein kinase beta subunit [Anaeramoeba ignava]
MSQLFPVTFRYLGEATSAFLYLSIDQWQKPHEMKKTENGFEVSLNLPAGKFYYRFAVKQNNKIFWVVDSEAPKEKNNKIFFLLIQKKS